MGAFRHSDYLALRQDPEILGLTFDMESVTDYGKQLRHQLARYFASESALLFPDGFMAFVALLRNSIQNGDVLCIPQDLDDEIWDALEIIQRIRSVTFRVLKTDSLEDVPKDASRLVLIASGISPITAKLFPADHWFQQLTEFYEKHGVPSLFLLEDSHGVGVLGEHGRGTFEHFGITPNIATEPMFASKPAAKEPAAKKTEPPKKTERKNDETDEILGADFLDEKPIPVQAYFSGSFAEAFGTNGGFITGRRKWLKNIHKNEASCCNQNQFPLSGIVVTTKALQMAMDPTRRETLRENIHALHQNLLELGIEFSGDINVPFVLIRHSTPEDVSRNLELRGHQVGRTHFTDEPQLRIAVSSAHSPGEIAVFCQELVKELSKQQSRKTKKEEP